MLLTETLRVGAVVLLVAGSALVAGAVLTQTLQDTSRLDEDPFSGFGFIGTFVVEWSFNTDVIVAVPCVFVFTASRKHVCSSSVFSMEVPSQSAHTHCLAHTCTHTHIHTRKCTQTCTQKRTHMDTHANTNTHIVHTHTP